MNTSPGATLPHAPGWYLNETADAWRWWDGRAWTNATRSRTDKRLRSLLTPWSYRIDRAVRIGAAIGLAISALLAGTAVVTHRTAIDAGVLAFLGMPFAFAFQFWILYVVRARYPARKDLGLRVWASWRWPNVFKFFVSAIPKTAAIALAATFYLAVFIGSTSFSDSGGVAQRGSADCPYQLNQHGDITCVSHAAYERERSGEERGLAALLCGFFAVHLAGSAGEVNRRRREGPSPTALIP
jgi:hypothetical protein